MAATRCRRPRLSSSSRISRLGPAAAANQASSNRAQARPTPVAPQHTPRPDRHFQPAFVSVERAACICRVVVVSRSATTLAARAGRRASCTHRHRVQATTTVMPRDDAECTFPNKPGQSKHRDCMSMSRTMIMAIILGGSCSSFGARSPAARVRPSLDAANCRVADDAPSKRRAGILENRTSASHDRCQFRPEQHLIVLALDPPCTRPPRLTGRVR
jgi:hypothetical protein